MKDDKEKLTELICENCDKDLCDPDFVCVAKICPLLDEFQKIGSLEIANTAPDEADGDEDFKNGGPAPSDTPLRIRFQ